MAKVKWLWSDVILLLPDGGSRPIATGDTLDMPDEEARSRAESGQVAIVADKKPPASG